MIGILKMKLEAMNLSILIMGAINYTSTLNLFDITLPYFTNTDLATLCKVLNDEERHT